MRSRTPIHRIGEERHARILTAALEVFSKSSYWDATTDEIARRAHVSKRDIYAEFPDKHAILAAVISRVLQTGDENLRRVIADSSQDRMEQRERLEIIGLALMSEILSPVTGFVARLVSSESISHPSIGSIYFESWHARRCELIAQVFLGNTQPAKSKARRPHDTSQASQHYLALISHLPQLTAGVGMRDTWNPKSIQVHVKSAVDCFLKAYPILA
jgi:AcrR family transcriptional regulator